MADKEQKKRSKKSAPVPQRLIWHIEAAVQEADALDPMAGFLLRVTIESIRKVAKQPEAETRDDAV